MFLCSYTLDEFVTVVYMYTFLRLYFLYFNKNTKNTISNIICLKERHLSICINLLKFLTQLGAHVILSFVNQFNLLIITYFYSKLS